MNRILASITFAMILISCMPQPAVIPSPTAYPTYTPFPTLTPYPTYTPYPTATAQPTIVITQVVVQTPTPKYAEDKCKPIEKMDYTDNSKVAILLQAYVASLPEVRSVSYVIPEKLYNNTLSQLYHVTYVADTDGKVYSKRYIVYMHEFGWTPSVFSIDGQCWVN